MNLSIEVRYPTISELRYSANESIKDKHLAYMDEVNQRIESNGVRWYYCKDTRLLTCVDIATGEVVESGR